MRRILIRCLAVIGLSCAALAHSAVVPSTQVEIYRIAPGQHVAFLKLIALYDQANVEAGLPPRQLYVHQDGANWDFLIMQSGEDWTDAQRTKFRAALPRLGNARVSTSILEIPKCMAVQT